MQDHGRDEDPVLHPAHPQPPKPGREKRPPPPPPPVLHPVRADEGTTRGTFRDEESAEEGELTVDIYDDGPTIVIQAMIAGVKPDDIDISLQEDTLTIRGSRKRVQEVRDENFYHRELYWGVFSRSVVLPEEVDFQKAQATIKGGLLTVKLPKKDKGEKKIQVRVGD